MNERILALIAAGQVYDAWSLLRSELADSVERFVAQHVPRVDLETLCQGVWNDVYRALPGYRAERTAVSWLLALARARLPIDSPATRSQSVARALFAARTSERVPISRRDLPALERAIAARPEDERELLELRYVNGLRSDEIAAIFLTSAPRIERDLMTIIQGLVGRRGALR